MSDEVEQVGDDDIEGGFDWVSDLLKTRIFHEFEVGVSLGKERSKSKEQTRGWVRRFHKDASEEEIASLVASLRQDEAKRRLRYRAMRPPGIDEKAGRITFAHSRECGEKFASFVEEVREFHRAEVAAGLSGRRGIAVALQLGLEVLRRVPSRHDLNGIVEPLEVLSDVLKGLDDGHVHPALQPKRRGRGRRSSPREVTLRMRCVLAAKALIETGLAPDEADRRVAGMAAPAAVAILGPRPHNQFTATTVRGWREGFQAIVRKSDFDSDPPAEAWAEDGFQMAKFRGEMQDYAKVLMASLALENIDLQLFKVTEQVRRAQAG